MISFLVLRPIQVENNQTISSVRPKYDKCGADFTESEYRGEEVVNQIERKTVDDFLIRSSFLLLVDQVNILCIVYVCICLCSILLVVLFLKQRRKADRGNASGRAFIVGLKFGSNAMFR